MPLFSFTTKGSTIQVNNPNINNFSYVRLNQISFYNGLYNVTTRNNKLLYKVSTTETGEDPVENIVTIDPGNYTVSDLITAIQNRSQLLITNNQGLGKLIFTLNGPDYFSIGASYNGLNSILGLSDTATPYVKTYTAPNMYQLVINNNLFLVTDLIESRGSYGTFQQAPILATIPLNKPFTDYIEYSPGNQLDFQQVQNMNNGKFYLKLVDSTGQVVDLNGLQLSITLEFENSNWSLWSFLVIAALLILILLFFWMIFRTNTVVTYQEYTPEPVYDKN